MEELKRQAYQRSFTYVSRKNTQSRKRNRWLLGSFLLVPVAIVLGVAVFWFLPFWLLPFPLQSDARTLYSTDWSKDFNAWQGTGWYTRLNGGVHSDHGGIFLSPYVADGTAIQLDVQMKNLGEDGFVNSAASFGIVLRRYGNTDYKIDLADDSSVPLSPDTYRVPLSPDTYHSLQDFALVSIKFQKGTVTLLINGKQVAQKSIDFPLKGTLGLFAEADSIVEARSFRVDKVFS